MMRIMKHLAVRTTVSIDDPLLEKAKQLALQEGVSISEIVNRSLRQALVAPATRSQGLGFRMLTFQGGTSTESEWTPEAIARLRDADAI
jgi:hypothetical protein